MNKHSIRWGLLVGSALILIKLLLYMTSKESMNSNFLTCTAFIPYLFGMYMAAKDQREAQGGQIRFWQAGKTAWMVSIIGSALILLFNYLIFFVLNPGLLDEMRDLLTTQMETMDMSFPEEYTDFMDQNFNLVMKLSFMFSFIFFGVIIGFIGSMIVASAVERSGEGTEDNFPTL